eukprot:658625-Hanusia_phi.AAC.8
MEVDQEGEGVRVLLQQLGSEDLKRRLSQNLQRLVALLVVQLGGRLVRGLRQDLPPRLPRQPHDLPQQSAVPLVMPALTQRLAREEEQVVEALPQAGGVREALLHQRAAGD